MKNVYLLLWGLCLALCAPSALWAQGFTPADYQKTEYRIRMRDGIHLHTTVYAPKVEGKFPALIVRTPYGCAPYGADQMPKSIMYNPDLVAAGYLFVHQDMRGRWMSEGHFENMKPPYSFQPTKTTDEITDTWDTFEWMAKNLKNYNQRVGIYGNSYRGWTALVAGVSQHPHLKAVLAMAPVADFFFEDFYRYGIFSLAYLPVMDVFGIHKEGPTTEAWYSLENKPFVLNHDKELYPDFYSFYLRRLALSNFADVVGPDNFFWQEFLEHPHYDSFRQQRNWLQYLHRIQCPTLIVGGWNDEQNLYGITQSFATLKAYNKNIRPQLVLGPWTHGAPQQRDSLYYNGDLYYGEHISRHYQQQVELPYFEFHLKGKGHAPDFEQLVMDQGTRTWQRRTAKFQPASDTLRLYLGANEQLTTEAATGFVEFLSDPAHPVPAVEEHHFEWMPPKHYTNDDQRFAATRPDVLVWEGPLLDTALCLDGTPEAYIEFESDHPDADIFLKIIDQYPLNRLPEPHDKPGLKMNGYQELVRLGMLRLRYREGYETPIPLKPNTRTRVRIPLLPILHTFGKGHRIIIQLQSSLFPLYEMNPQNWVPNVFLAQKKDFEWARHRVHFSSTLLLPKR